MTPMAIGLLALLFILVSGLSWMLIGFTNAVWPMLSAGRLRDFEFFKREVVYQMLGLSQRLSPLLRPIASDAAQQMDWMASPLRLKLVRAGFRGQHAVPLYYLAKLLTAGFMGVALLLAASLGGWELSPLLIFGVVVLAMAIGLFLPDLFLRLRLAERQRKILEHLPDSLDLIRICVEAGLGLDAAILRVSQEFKRVCRPLFEELHTITLELRAGSSRNEALKNFATRTGLPQASALVSTLIQSDRFGTGIADTIRIHAEHLRLERRLKAEETAAKMATKLLFPLVFCIFPALLLVLVGPAGITVKQHLSPEITGR